jgi:hypothetical protein
MDVMALVASEGLLDQKSLLQLSVARTRLVTRPVRHQALKHEMLVQKAFADTINTWDRQARKQKEEEHTLAVETLLDIAITNHETATRSRAFGALVRMNGLATALELAEWRTVRDAEPHWAYVYDSFFTPHDAIERYFRYQGRALPRYQSGARQENNVST